MEYAFSQQQRKSIEQGFGWAKTVGHMRQVLMRGLEKVDQMFVLTMTAYNLTLSHTIGQVRLQGTPEFDTSTPFFAHFEWWPPYESITYS
jgi:hypothetical protein